MYSTKVWSGRLGNIRDRSGVADPLFVKKGGQIYRSCISNVKP